LQTGTFLFQDLVPPPGGLNLSVFIRVNPCPQKSIIESIPNNFIFRDFPLAAP